MPSNMPGLTKMVHDHHIVNRAVVQYEDSKEDYIQNCALFVRTLCLEKLASIQKNTYNCHSMRIQALLSNNAIFAEFRKTIEKRLEEPFLQDPEVFDWEEDLQCVEEAMKSLNAS